jgi:MFS family permease
LSRECRLPLIIAISLHIGQQLSGVNAIFFYSSDIFKSANIPAHLIQYAILSTGVVNFLMTLVTVPLIERLGRKLLLTVPIAIIIVDFILLVLFLTFKHYYAVFSYLSTVCILVFIMGFAVGLGPVPFLYTAEIFNQKTRSSAMAIAVTVNWLSTLLISFFFPLLSELMGQYVFCVFMVIMGGLLTLLLTKVILLFYFLFLLN